MIATEELTPTKPWRELPLIDLKGPRGNAMLPSAAREHLVNLGIDTLGKLSDALDDGRDIGMGDRAETLRDSLGEMAREEAEADESEVVHVPKGAGGDGAATETIGASVNRVIDAIPGANGVHALPNGEKVQAGQLPDEREARAKILEAAGECDAAETVFLVANERAKEAKKKFEGAKANLREVVRWSNTPIPPEEPNLFSGVKEPAAALKPGVDFDQIDNGDSSAIEDCWRAFPLSRFEQFGLPASLIETLGGQGIATVGQLSDYTKPNASGYTQRLADLKGVGPAKVQKIEDGLIAFWAWWPNNRNPFAAELGLIENGNAPATGTGSEGVEHGNDDPASATADPATANPAHNEPEAKQPGRRRAKAK